MSKLVSWVDGWEIRRREDHAYGLYDEHGLVAGPFGTEAAAIRAALCLPKRPQVHYGRDVSPHLMEQS
jgi:hypothetical protein